MAIYYLGAFPIEGGGVTNKNRDILDALKKNGIKIIKVDMNKLKRKKNIFELIKLISSLIPGNRYIIGVSGARGTSIKLIKFLNLVSRTNLKKSIYFMMGGTESRVIAGKRSLVKIYGSIKRLFVETSSMEKTLNDVGLNNVSLFPNCRPRPEKQELKNKLQKIRCVFLSDYESKIDLKNILEIAKLLPEIQIDFYGDISDEHKDVFSSKIHSSSNFDYYGQYSNNLSEICEILEKYSLLLFPQISKDEEMQQVLCAARLVSIPIITDNKKIVENGLNGILLNDDSLESTYTEIKRLYDNPELLLKLKNACLFTNTKNKIKECIDKCTNNKLKCLFFSNIQPEKGVDIIIEAAKQLCDTIEIHLYGTILKEYETEFRQKIEKLSNLKYHGVFTGNTEQLYEIMNRYDILLLPTRWKNEGVPGVLIEAKMAGLPVIVTDHNYNKEIVHQFVDGIILENYTSKALEEALIICARNRILIDGLRTGCEYHKDEYDIKTYLPTIINELR